MVNNATKSIMNKINMFNFIVFMVKIFGVLFFCYSFVSFVFWFLNCFEVDWLYLFNWLFIIPYQIVNIFYKPVGVSADFTLAIVGVLSFLLGLICQSSLNYFYEKIIHFEDEYERIKAQQRELRAKRLAKRSIASLAENNETKVQQEAKLVFLVASFFDKLQEQSGSSSVSFQAAEDLKQIINKELIRLLVIPKPMQKGYYRKNLFLTFRNFNHVDNFIKSMKTNLSNLCEEYKKDNVNLRFSVVLSAIFDTAGLQKELDCMDTILSLNLSKNIIATGRFKINYDSLETSNYTLHLEGEYNLSKNLTVSNNQPVYSLSSKNK